MNPREETAKGEQARTLLDDPLFNEAFDTLEATLVDAVLALPIEAVDLHKAAQQARAILGAFVAGGDIARSQILEEERKQSVLERIKERLRHG